MSVDRTGKPQTTLKRALLTLGLCVVFVASVMTLGTATGWVANPRFGPHSVLETITALFAAFGLWAFNVGAFLAIVAGVPWAILHLLGFRSWWVAPLAGFAVAFAIAFFVTTQGSHSPNPELHSSAWIQGRAIMIDGRLTPYGQTMYGPEAAVRNGLTLGIVGAVFALVLWRIAYPESPPSRSSPEAKD